MLIAELEGDPVGVVVALPQSGFLEIKRLWATPSARGRGVGSALLDAAVPTAEREVRLAVWDWRDAAVRLYESRGFRRAQSWDERDRLLCLMRPA